MKTRFLFVDDEPLVLSGLRRTLRSMRKEWDMDFAQGAAEALELLDREPYDVVVSDMRMPYMDGAELLSEVKKRHPRTIRIILSGYADDESLIRALGPTQQYLSKPCDPDLLRLTVGRAHALHQLFEDERLKLYIGQMTSLPSIPSVYVELTELLKSPDASIKGVGDIISRDMGMTGKILQLVNSAYFGLSRHVPNPATAASLLGIDTVKALVLSVQVFSQFDEAKTTGFSIAPLWRHSIAVGAIAKEMAKMEGYSQKATDDTLMAGLLHDAGKLVLASCTPEKYAEVVAMAHEERVPFDEAERNVLGITHAEVGAYMLGTWGMPDPTIEAVAFHHRPGDCPFKAFHTLTAVHTADALEHQISNPDEPAGQLDVAYLKELGLLDRVTEWKDRTREIMAQGEEH